MWRCTQESALPKALTPGTLRSYLRTGVPAKYRKALWMASVHPAVAASLQGTRLPTPTPEHRAAAEQASKAVLHHSGARIARVNSTAVARVVLGGLAFAHENLAQYISPYMSLAALLLVHLNETQATAVLATMLRRCQAGYLLLVRDRNTLAIMLHAFDDVALKHAPRVAAHATRSGTHTSLLVSDWFSCLWLGCLPFDLVLRVVDAFVFQVGVARHHAAVGIGGGGLWVGVGGCCVRGWVLCLGS